MNRLRAVAAFALTAALLMACAHAPVPSAAGSQPIAAMTFNIRLDLATDGENAWPHRRAHVAALIAHEAPDIAGLQEVLLHQKRDLEAALPAYAMIGVGRDDGHEAGEFAPIAYRTARFELVDSGTFWLSPTPDTPGKGWDAALPRIASWAVLRDRASGARVRVLNTHFDHLGEEARRESAALIGRWVAGGEASGLPTVVMGDFNAMPESEPYRRLADTATTGLADSRAISNAPPYGPRGTFTGFRIDRDAPGAIDHIFVTRHFAVTSHAVVTQHWAGRLPSDHYPVVTMLQLEPR